MKSNLSTYRKFTGNQNTLQPDAALFQHFRTLPGTITTSKPASQCWDESNNCQLHTNETWLQNFDSACPFLIPGNLISHSQHWHPRDFEIITMHVFPALASFIKKLKKGDYPLFIFSYNYRLVNQYQEIRTILQRFTLQPGSLPADTQRTFGVAFDITHFKNDTTIIYTIEKMQNPSNTLSRELVQKNIISTDEDKSLHSLSKKEKEVLRLLAQGMSSKQIAAKMFLSINTINNHRKHILAKTGCNTAAEVLTLAAKQRLV